MNSSEMATLSPDIRDALNELQELETQLLGAVNGDGAIELEPMAETRERLLVRICDALAALEDTDLRRATLLSLLDANRRIGDAASTALGETILLSREGAHQRKAISAYGAVIDDPG